MTSTSAPVRNITASGVNGGFRAEAGSGDIRGNGIRRRICGASALAPATSTCTCLRTRRSTSTSPRTRAVSVGHPVTTTVQGRVQESARASSVESVAVGRWSPCTLDRATFGFVFMRWVLIRIEDHSLLILHLQNASREGQPVCDFDPHGTGCRPSQYYGGSVCNCSRC